MKQSKVCDLSAAVVRMGGNARLLEQVIVLFQDDAPQILSNLQAAVAAHDIREIQRAAHSLKGLALNFDGEAAALAAVKVEGLAKSGELASGDAAIHDLEREIGRLLEALSEEVKKLPLTH